MDILNSHDGRRRHASDVYGRVERGSLNNRRTDMANNENHVSVSATANGYVVRYGSASESWVFESFAGMMAHLRDKLPVFQPQTVVAKIKN